MCVSVVTLTDIDESWYPKEKVQFARRKLNGDNCAHIMRYYNQFVCVVLKLRSQHLNWTELQFTTYSSVNSPIGMHVFRTKRPTSLQCM